MTIDIQLAGSIPAPSHPRNLAEHFLVGLIRHLELGRITVEMPSGRRFEYRAGTPGPEAVLILHRWRALRLFLTGGDIGFAEAYMAGDWSTPDLARLIELAARNESRLRERFSAALPVRALNRLVHWRRDNSKNGSRRNIEAHYDLGNEFYARWLDRGMSYSSALYTRPDQSLEEAQEVKLGKIVDLLDLKGGERVLEIGCGWGGLAEHLAARGYRVTGVTLSPSQLDYARRRIAAVANAERVDLQLTDYRDLDGQFDRIVSIEMLEAVGRRYWPRYFATLRDRLMPGGTAVLQVITIADDRFDRYAREVDFIQRHIFPGGMLPSDGIIRRQAEAAGLRLVSHLNFGQSYARTLAEWRTRFLASWREIEAAGFPASFKRMWEYYLAYCEAGFRSGSIDVALYRLAKPAG